MSYTYNHVTLLGRVTYEPEHKEISESLSVTSFVLAVSRTRRKETTGQDTDFIRISLWGKAADRGFQMLKKGNTVLVWGRVHVNTYEKDKVRKKSTEIVADNFQVLSSSKKTVSEELAVPV